MRVFVVGTGRCGTCTFYQACKHITNYIVGHESQAGMKELPTFPDNHIEVSAGLIPLMGHLTNKYPGALWVHLRRNRKECVESLAENCAPAMRRFAENWFHLRYANPYNAARLFHTSMNQLIAQFLFDSQEIAIREIYFQSRKAQRQVRQVTAMRIEIERAASSWEEFWKAIGAKGDITAGMKEFQRKYNPTSNRGRDNYEGVLRPYKGETIKTNHPPKEPYNAAKLPLKDWKGSR